MTIELDNKRRKIKLPKWLSIILFFSLAGILFLGSSYFYLNKELTAMKKDVEIKEKMLNPTTEEKEMENEIKLISEKIKLFQSLILKHRDSSKIFKIVENDCLSNVQFTNFNFNADDLTINLSGRTDDFISLQRQVDAFKEDQLVSKVILSGMSMSDDESGVTFSISLSINKKVFSENNKVD